MRSTMLAASERAVRGHRVLALTSEGAAAFLEAITNPPEPNENLRALASESRVTALGCSDEGSVGEMEPAMVLRDEPEEKGPEHYMSLLYTVEVKHDPGSEWPWFARVVELPGCMTWAETFEKLGPMIEDAKRGWIEDALEHGDPVPEPRSSE